MEKLLESGNALTAIAVLLSLHFLKGLGEFLWKLREKRDAVTETGIEKLSAAVQDNTLAAQRLEHRIGAVEHTLADVAKTKLDLRRLFSAVKELAGEDWSKIRSVIMEIEG